MHHLKTNALGLAFAVVGGIGYVVCSALYALWPAESLTYSSYLSHNLNFAPLAGNPMTWGSFFAGLIVWFILSYVGGALFAWFYNQFAK